MIARLIGKVASKADGHIVLDVNGVGYLVFCSGRTLDHVGQQGEKSMLHIETHVREDHIHLYGFADHAEQGWFNLLITVQGVGAKVCLAMLSTLDPETLIQAIASGDKTMLCRADGVGPKLAARIITELKDKVSNMSLGSGAQSTETKAASQKTASAMGLDQAVADAVSALINLGYGRGEAFSAVNKIRGQAEKADVSELIRLGLKELSA